MFLELMSLFEVADPGLTGGDAEPTPEETAVILGETPPVDQPEETPTSDEKTPEEGGETVPAETPPAEGEPLKSFTQVEVNKIVTERLDRDRKTRSTEEQGLKDEVTNLRSIVNKIAEGRATPEAQGLPTAPKTPDQVGDVGQFLNDPTYEGWSMEAMKTQHPDHYEHCKTRVMNKIDADTRWSDFSKSQETAKTEEAYETHLKTQLGKVKELMGNKATDFFTHDGRYNEKFNRDYVQWGLNNGIADPLLAFELKGEDGGLKKHLLSDAELQDVVNEAVKKGGLEVIKNANKGGGDQPRVNSQTPSTGKAITDMSDQELGDYYDNDKNLNRGEVRKILVQRGLLA